MALSDEKKIAIANEYLRRLDTGDPKLLELFDEDVLFYFPKFGVGRGREAILQMFKGFEGITEWIKHDYAKLVFIPNGDRLAVEGTSAGKIAGVPWKGGETPGGRFCNVFEFRGDRISRLFVYLDPDYLGEDMPRFRWGKDGRAW